MFLLFGAHRCAGNLVSAALKQNMHAKMLESGLLEPGAFKSSEEHVARYTELFRDVDRKLLEVSGVMCPSCVSTWTSRKRRSSRRPASVMAPQQSPLL